MAGMNIPPMSKVILVIALFASPLSIGSQATAPENRKKVAEGEYGSRPKTGQYEIRELWTLWRKPDGRYLLSGEVKFSEVGSGPERTLQYELNLSGELKPNDIRLSYREMKGVFILFQFGDTELRYQAGRRGLVQPETTTLPVSAPYSLYPTTSWWQLGLLCREANAAQRQRATVQLVFVDDPPPEPIGLHPFEAHVEYLGEEEVEVDGGKFKAGKFLVQGESPESGADPFPRVTAWVLPEGLLVKAKADDLSQIAVELVRFKKYGEFGPAK